MAYTSLPVGAEDIGERPRVGIFVLSEIEGPLGDTIREIQQRFDPKLATTGNPHITIAGSSGVGPIRVGVSADEIRDALEPIAADTAPITVRFAAPMRFMQTEIFVLPIDPHGPLRTLHERIARTGLPFEQARFPFTPHCTLSFYPVLPPEERRELLKVRVNEPVTIDRLQVFHTQEFETPRLMLELELRGKKAASGQRSAVS